MTHILLAVAKIAANGLKLKINCRSYIPIYKTSTYNRQRKSRADYSK